MKSKQEIQDTISALVIEQLEKGIVPWRKPWTSAGYLPTSLTTGKTYGGINLLILSIVGSNYSRPLWITYKEAEKRGGNIKRGEKGTPIIKWSIYDKRDKETGETHKAFFLKEFTVFNIDQTEGLSIVEPAKREPITIHEGIPALLADYASKPEIYHSASDRAYYSPLLDSIHLPLVEQFTSAEEYALTLAHELTHSTGHQSRLNRFADEKDEPAVFGSANYAKEELVADIGANMLLNHYGMELSLTNSASYVAGWLKALNNDTSLILSASTKAQKAVDYMTNKVREEVAA